MCIFGYSLYFVVFLVSLVDSRGKDGRYHHPMYNWTEKQGSLYIAGYTIVPGVTAVLNDLAVGQMTAERER